MYENQHFFDKFDLVQNCMLKCMKFLILTNTGSLIEKVLLTCEIHRLLELNDVRLWPKFKRNLARRTKTALVVC